MRAAIDVFVLKELLKDLCYHSHWQCFLSAFYLCISSAIYAKADSDFVLCKWPLSLLNKPYCAKALPSGQTLLCFWGVPY